MLTLICGIQKRGKDDHLLQNRNKGTDVENKCNGCQEGEGGDELGGWSLTYTLLCVKRVTSENLLYSTGKCCVLCGALDGKEIQKADMCWWMVGSLLWRAETSTAE